MDQLGTMIRQENDTKPRIAPTLIYFTKQENRVPTIDLAGMTDNGIASWLGFHLAHIRRYSPMTCASRCVSLSQLFFQETPMLSLGSPNMVPGERRPCHLTQLYQ